MKCPRHSEAVEEGEHRVARPPVAAERLTSDLHHLRTADRRVPRPATTAPTSRVDEWVWVGVLIRTCSISTPLDVRSLSGSAAPSAFALALPCVRVRGIKSVTAGAHGLLRVECRGASASQRVLALRDLLEVLWIHAPTITTAVIDGKVRVENGETRYDVPMRELHLAVRLENAVPVSIGRGGPVPAARHRARLNLVPEALGYRRIHEVHASPPM
jgi:hypothetical protein